MRACAANNSPIFHIYSSSRSAATPTASWLLWLRLELQSELDSSSPIEQRECQHARLLCLLILLRIFSRLTPGCAVQFSSAQLSSVRCSSLQFGFGRRQKDYCRFSLRDLWLPVSRLHWIVLRHRRQHQLLPMHLTAAGCRWHSFTAFCRFQIQILEFYTAPEMHWK